MPQPASDLPLLDLRPRELLLLLRLELHFRVVLCAGVCCRGRCAADVTADVAGSRPGIFESIKRDSKMAFVRDATIGYVPLFWT